MYLYTISLRIYSFLKLFTGLVKAALMACELMVMNAIAMAEAPAMANTHHCTLTA
jgi:hypothetical protein